MGKIMIMAGALLLMLSAYINAEDFDLPEHILRNVEYSKATPVIKVDHLGDLHILCSSQERSRPREELVYYKYRAEDFKLVDSFIDKSLIRVGYSDDLYIDEHGVVYFSYYHEGEWSKFNYHIAMLNKNKIHKFGIGSLDGRWIAILPEDGLLMSSSNVPYRFQIFKPDETRDKFGDIGRFIDQWKKFPLAICDEDAGGPFFVKARSIMLYLGDSIFLVTSYGVATDKKGCRENVLMFLYDWGLDSITTVRAVDLFQESMIVGTDLDYDQVSVYLTDDSLIHVVAGRAHADIDEDAKLCCFAIDRNLMELQPESIGVERGTEHISLTDSRIDHQIFWLRPSADSSCRGQLLRYCFMGDKIYYSESRTLYDYYHIVVNEGEDQPRE